MTYALSYIRETSIRIMQGILWFMHKRQLFSHKVSLCSIKYSSQDTVLLFVTGPEEWLDLEKWRNRHVDTRNCVAPGCEPGFTDTLFFVGRWFRFDD